MIEPHKKLLDEAIKAIGLKNNQLAYNYLATILKHAPNHLDALLLKAKIEHSEFEFDLARQTLIVTLNQKNISERQLSILAIQLNQMELFSLLLDVLRRKLELDPTSKEIPIHITLCLAKIGKIDEAIKMAKECEIKGNINSTLLLNLGHSFKAKGNSQQAVEKYRKFIELQHDMIGTGYWSIADLKDYQFDSNDIVKLKSILAAPPPHNRSKTERIN